MNPRVSWNTGKDSAWMLYQLNQDKVYEVTALFYTVNGKFQRTAMHDAGSTLKYQAEQAGLPLHIIEIPHPCSNVRYESIMADFLSMTRKQGVEKFALVNPASFAYYP